LNRRLSERRATVVVTAVRLFSQEVHVKRVLVTFVLAIWVSACGGSNSPTAPAVVIPQYGATWSGSYTVTGCTQTGDLVSANVCSNFPTGTVAPFTMTLAQTGTAITPGTFSLGGVAFVLQPATIASNGALALIGSATVTTVTIVTTWALTAPIVGTQSQAWTTQGLTGQVTVTSVVGSTVKTASLVTSGDPPTSLADALRAIRQR
jgi:hypothetical protein